MVATTLQKNNDKTQDCLCCELQVRGIHLAFRARVTNNAEGLVLHGIQSLSKSRIRRNGGSGDVYRAGLVEAFFNPAYIPAHEVSRRPAKFGV